MIPSFQINHDKLRPGLYVSRVDNVGKETITTYDIRVCTPNKEQMRPEAAHTIEHLMADYLRNESPLKKSVIYFGPMGCMTGFYLILSGKIDTGCLIRYLKEAFAVCRTAIDIPGNTSVECGNYKYHNLEGAKKMLSKYLTEVLEQITSESTSYPE